MFKRLNALIILIVLALIAQGCSTMNRKDSKVVMGENGEIVSYHGTDSEPPRMKDDELDTIPTEVNPMVEKWIAYFQGRGRPHMEVYLARSTRYSKLMKRILRQNGLPEDLIYIAMIESGFSSKATSTAAAVGYWQFIRGTGKRYGLEINSLVDERRDPVLATQAAAEYYKGLYSIFGSWYLAMASYNVGENRVKREVMTHYTRDFWELARRRRLPAETINYIPKFIAAKMIGNDPKKYGFDEVDYQPEIEFDHIKIDKPVNLHLMADKMNIEYDDLKQLNPKFKGEVAPLKGTMLELRVPPGTQEAALIAANMSAVERIEYIADSGDTKTYKVRSGDSLYTIARKFKTTVAWIRDVNDLQKGRKLRIGQKVIVPDGGGGRVTKFVAKNDKSKKPEAKPQPKQSINLAKDDTPTQDESESASNVNPEVVTAKGVYYIVQPGDTLSAIANDYSSSVQELRRMNKLGRKAILRAGMKLRVPKDEGLPSDPSSGEDGRVATRGSSQRNPSAKSGASSQVNHVVKPGENLHTIAKKYGVSIDAIREANNMQKKSVLKVGARLVIPGNQNQARVEKVERTVAAKSNRTAAAVATSQARAKSQKMAARKDRFHVVKRGENLSQIADRYQIPVNVLKEQNRLGRGSKLFVGAKILIPSARAVE